MLAIVLELAVLVVVALWALVAAGKFLELVRRISQSLDEIKRALQASSDERKS